MKDRKLYLKAIAIYQIAGGIIGVGIVLWILILYIYPNDQYNKILLTFLSGIATTLYCYSIYCGVLLVKNKRNGIEFSIINQLLQIIHFSLFGYAFKYFSGIFVTLIVDMVNDIYTLEWGISSWEIIVGDNTGVINIGINFVAVLFVILLERIKRFPDSETESLTKDDSDKSLLGN